MRTRIVRAMRATVLGAAATSLTLAALTPASAGTPIPPRLRAALAPATAYVVNNGSKTVTPVNTATNVAGKPIKVGSDPDPIAVTPNGKTVYVASEGAGTITPISTATNVAGKPIAAGTIPVTIAVTP
jgi:DNA-binding beta-propeller fold protein YncE